jgi:hypothetical protein
MNMKSMKLPKGAKDPYTANMVGKPKPPKFPWGLEIRLETAALKKLGKKAGDFTAGDELTIAAKAEVVGVSLDERQGFKSETVTLQITAMDLTGDDYSKAMAEAVKEKK